MKTKSVCYCLITMMVIAALTPAAYAYGRDDGAQKISKKPIQDDKNEKNSTSESSTDFFGPGKGDPHYSCYKGCIVDHCIKLGSPPSVDGACTTGCYKACYTAEVKYVGKKAV